VRVVFAGLPFPKETRKMASQGPESKEEMKRIVHLVNELADDDPQIRQQAIDVLGEMAPQVIAGIPGLIKNLIPDIAKATRAFDLVAPISVDATIAIILAGDPQRTEGMQPADREELRKQVWQGLQEFRKQPPRC
jgi:hypothetical protein